MYIFGASQHSKVVFDAISPEQKNKFVGFLDDNPMTENWLGFPLIKYNENQIVVGKMHIAIGNNKIRKTIASRFPKLSYFNIIHKSSVISNSAKLSIGVSVMPNVAINAEAEIGNHCILNTGCVIEHECKIADFVHIAPNVTLAGCVNIGEGTLIGAGAAVIQGIIIGKWCTIGAGAVIISDVPDYAVVVGNPGKIMKYNEQF